MFSDFLAAFFLFAFTNELPEMQPQQLKTDHHYLRFSIEPACAEPLTVRKAFQDALLQTFGLTSANTYIDVLWLAENGTGVVIRLNTQ